MLREITWVWEEVHMMSEGAAGLGLVSLLGWELSTALVLKPLFWTTSSGAAFSLLVALLYGVPTLVLD